MELHIWFAFVAASTVLVLIPGPTVLMVIGDALANSRRQGWSTVLGVGLGDAVAMGLSLAGAGALLRTSAAAFSAMKLLGGVYLIYLGVRSILGARHGGDRTSPASSAGSLRAEDVAPNRSLTAAPRSVGKRFARAWTVTVLNPKSILFFVAFLPQFISGKSPFVSQAALLMTTFVALAMLNATIYMSLAGLLGEKLTSPAAQRKVGYAGGGTLIAAGTLTLALKHR